jgi:asparagine synthase (glutamine-hydrolysing)
MFAFALVVDEGTVDSRGARVDEMLNAWPYGAAEERGTQTAGHAAAGMLRWHVNRRDRAAQPLWDKERQMLFVGDVRLFNRREICEAISAELVAERSDLELAWLAYLRWGSQTPLHLKGDFAFAVWDERRRELFAARDHLGIRPLYYCVERDRVLVASDVAQIVGVAAKRSQIEAKAILERFSAGPRTPGLTFYRDVLALPAGHSLSLSRGLAVRRRYWTPALREDSGLTYREHCGELRDIFYEAVRSRLESDAPIVAHSSGGFDSSSILMAANEIYGKSADRPILVMASATTLGMPCDDSVYMDAVARSVSFRGVRWSALDACLDDVEDPVVGFPGQRRGVGGGPKEEANIARSLGAKVLLTGALGDTLMHSSGVLRDMVRAGLWGQVFAELLVLGRPVDSIRLLLKSLSGYLPPQTALLLLNAWSGRSSRRVPSWMGALLRDIYPLPREQLDHSVASTSHATTEIWARLNSCLMASVIDATAMLGSRHGLEVRMPFADTRLVEKVLEVPWRHRMPRGDHRRLGRDALGSLLPSAFRSRTDQGTWGPVWALQARRLLPSLRCFLSDSEWVSEPFVERAAVKDMYAVAERSQLGDRKLLITLSEFAVLEAWLRKVRRTIKCDI